MVPYLGDLRIPDSLVCQLGKILHRGSWLYELGREPDPLGSRGDAEISASQVPGGRDLEDYDSVSMESNYGLGNTESGSLVPRERFSYWCFDLLFLICSNSTTGILRSAGLMW